VIRYLIRRILWAGALFVAVTAVTYVIFVVPVDPARLSCGRAASPDRIARARVFLRLDVRPGRRARLRRPGGVGLPPGAAVDHVHAALRGALRPLRARLLEALGEDCVRTARAKGAPEWIVVRSHVLRNGLLPLVTMVGLDVGIALGGSVFTETVFNLPGLGRTLVGSVRASTCP